MNRIENIILTLAVAAALLVANTANANPDPCPKTGAKNDRPVVKQEDPRDGLHGTPVVKTPNGTRPARDLELEVANADSGTKPEDGLPGRPVVKTPNGTRPARDLELEEANADSGNKPEDGLPGRPVLRTPNGTRTARDLEAEQVNDPCPKDNGANANRNRTQTVDRASKFLRKASGRVHTWDNHRDRTNELADRLARMDSLAKNGKPQQKDKNEKNTTLGKALSVTSINPNRLKSSTTKTETVETGSTKITLGDGTVIWTGPDSDGFGTSVTEPNGDETQIYPDGTVSRRNVKNPKSGTLTRKPDGTTIVHDGDKNTLTITDKDGNTITRPMKFFDELFKAGMTYDDLMDLMFPKRKGGAANGGKKSKHPNRNTTLDDTLRQAGLSRDDLKNATSVTPSKHDKSVKIVLKDGTEIWTGPDSDTWGSSVTKPNGDQIEFAPNGTTRIRKGKDGKTITRRLDGITFIDNPKDGTTTIIHKDGKRVKLTNKELTDLLKNDKDPADLVRPNKKTR